MKYYLHLSAYLTLAAVMGCSPQNTSVNDTPVGTVPTVDGSQYLLKAEPADATTVIDARKAAEDGDPVVLIGRIGGSANPWIDDRTAFTIVDESLKACSDIPGDKCPQPWDYCCETDKLPNATALIKVVDDSGSLLRADAKQLWDVTELSTVVIEGVAQRDDAGNLTVLANGLFIKQK